MSQEKPAIDKDGYTHQFLPDLKPVLVGIYETNVFGAIAHHAKCLKSGCGWKSKRYDKLKQAQDAAKNHSKLH